MNDEVSAEVKPKDQIRWEGRASAPGAGDALDYRAVVAVLGTMSRGNGSFDERTMQGLGKVLSGDMSLRTAEGASGGEPETAGGIAKDKPKRRLPQPIPERFGR